MGGEGSGGAREGAGRKRVLKNPRQITVGLEPAHLKVLRRVQKTHNLATLSDAVRWMIAQPIPGAN